MNWPLFLCLSLVLCSAEAATKNSNPTMPVTYEGGTLPLSQGRATATISGNHVVFSRGHRKVAISLQKIATISCTTDVRRRFGAPLLGMVPLLHLDTARAHYVGLTWVGNNRDGQPAGRIEAVLRLSESEYSDFLTTLERATGKKAVDSNRIPTVVRYGL